MMKIIPFRRKNFILTIVDMEGNRMNYSSNRTDTLRHVLDKIKAFNKYRVFYIKERTGKYFYAYVPRGHLLFSYEKDKRKYPQVSIEPNKRVYRKILERLEKVYFGE